MGCGTSSNVVPAPARENIENDHEKAANGNGVRNGHGGHHDDDLPTVVLPDTPAKPKPPIAFEIPIEEIDGSKHASTPPPHLQRLLEPPQPEISLPDIEEKLAEAELRRQSILQQRAASAQKRTLKILKNVQSLEKSEIQNEMNNSNKHGPNTLTIPPGTCEDKNIT